MYVFPWTPAARATRFTNAGDTILCGGVESSSAPEAALERSRRLEVYLADGSLREKVASRIAEAFKKAFVEGYFKVPSIARRFDVEYHQRMYGCSYPKRPGASAFCECEHGGLFPSSFLVVFPTHGC